MKQMYIAEISTTVLLLLFQVACGDVKAGINYHVDDGTRPYFYGYRREGIEEGKIDAGGISKEKEVIIANGREHKLSLDANSFELTSCETSLTNAAFYEDDDAEVKEVYYKQMAECVKQKLNASHVFVFHHQVRNKERSNGAPNVLNTNIQGYANGAHSDTHPESAEMVYAFLSQHVDSKFRGGRYMYLNLWRSIDDEHPVLGNHLALLDQTSLTEGVGSEDYVESDFHGVDPKSNYKYSIKQYRLNEKNSDAHRWYYFPNMTKSEAILFKQWDSDPERETNLCFHSAFEDPTTPKDAPSRQSIEIRMMAFFPDHVPNTCPDSTKVMVYVTLMTAFFFASQYPLSVLMLSLGTLAVSVYALLRCCRKKKPQEIKKDE